MSAETQIAMAQVFASLAVAAALEKIAQAILDS